MTTITPDKTPEGWGDVATAYDRSIAGFTQQYAREAIRAADIKPGERVLDVATGPGTAAILAAEVGADVVATDFSPGMIERLRSRIASEGIARVDAQVMDAQNLSFPDESFDVALCSFGAMFFPDQVAGLREMRRVLRPGGRAVVVTWCDAPTNQSISIFGQATRITIPDLPPPDAPPAVFSIPTPTRMRRHLDAAGFRDVRVEPVVKFWTSDSPEDFWNELAYGTPVFSWIAGIVGDRVQLIQNEVTRQLKAQFGDDPIEIPAVALVGRGSK